MTWLFSKALMDDYENSRCSRAQAVESSAGSCSDGARSAQLNVMPTQHPFWHKGKTMESSNHSQFGQTLQVLTESRGANVLTSYLAGFPARISAQPEKALASTAHEAAYGHKVRGLLTSRSQQGFYWKTAQCSLLADSDEFSETWPQWGLMRNGECWELEKPDFPTSETACGFSLPTPSGVNGGNNHTMGRVDEWGGSSNPLRGTVIGSMCLPRLEEMAMGWPVSWTVLTAYETDKFHAWSLEHGKP